MKPMTSRAVFDLNRRYFLRGLGACLALPAMESLRPFRAFAAEASTTSAAATATATATAAAATASGAPLRTAFLYFPNGAIPAAWWPKETGAEFELSRTLQPLAKSRRSIQVMGGLEALTANPGPDGGGDHARGNGTFLTGVRLKKSATDIRAGISIDQVLAREIGNQTRFASLELTCDAIQKSGACDSGYSCAYQHNISWSSPTTPMTPEVNPRLAFERLFGAGAPGQRALHLKRRQQEQRSILDFVRADARELQSRLNPRDAEKLDQYLTGVREVETRIQRAERFGAIKDPEVTTPAGIPSDYAQHVQLMVDLMVLAFQTDATRVATLLLAHDGSNRSFASIGVPEGHHDISHHQDKPELVQKLTDIDQWYVQQFGLFLEKLDGIRDIDGRSVLDNSMIVYGSGNADSNRHTHFNLPIVLAGGGGGTLNPGRHVKHGGKPLSNLFLSLADRMGVKHLERFGDSTGRLADV